MHRELPKALHPGVEPGPRCSPACEEEPVAYGRLSLLPQRTLPDLQSLDEESMTTRMAFPFRCGIFSKQPLLRGAGGSLVYPHGYNGPLGTAISQFSCGGGCGVAPPSSKALLPQAASPEVASVPPGSLSLIQPLTNRILAGKGSLVRNVKSGFFLKQGPTLQ